MEERWRRDGGEVEERWRRDGGVSGSDGSIRSRAKQLLSITKARVPRRRAGRHRWRSQVRSLASRETGANWQENTGIFKDEKNGRPEKDRRGRLMEAGEGKEVEEEEEEEDQGQGKGERSVYNSFHVNGVHLEHGLRTEENKTLRQSSSFVASQFTKSTVTRRENQQQSASMEAAAGNKAAPALEQTLELRKTDAPNETLTAFNAAAAPSLRPDFHRKGKVSAETTAFSFIPRYDAGASYHTSLEPALKKESSERESGRKRRRPASVRVGVRKRCRRDGSSRLGPPPSKSLESVEVNVAANRLEAGTRRSDAASRAPGVLSNSPQRMPATANHSPPMLGALPGKSLVQFDFSIEEIGCRRRRSLAFCSLTSETL
ncbi:uncharacterized protein V6R79_009755 [Siganus canaliculatus]